MLEGYTEKHHIIPRCMMGTDSAINLTSLTYREHQFAHKILTKIYPNNTKLAQAAVLMKAVTVSSKLVMSKFMKENNPARFGAWNSGTRGNGKSLRKTPIRDEERLAIAERMKANNPNATGTVNAKKTMVTNVETGETLVFPTLKEAEEQISNKYNVLINHVSVWNNMKKGKPYKGYKWEFIT